MAIETLTFATREQWLAARTRDVTASAIGCLVDGVNHPYCTPAQLHLLKTGEADDSEETVAMERGKLLEPVAIQILAKEFPDWLCSHNRVPGPGRYYRDTDLRIGATPDVLAFRQGSKGIVQIKTVAAPLFARWKDEDGESFAVPEWIACQALTEAKLTGSSWAAVAVLVVGFGLELHVIEVPLHDDWWQGIKAGVASFWSRVDQGLAPEFDYERDRRLVASLWSRDDGSVIDLSGDNEFIDTLHIRAQLSEEAKTVKAELDRTTTLIKAKMGPAQVAIAGDWKVTLKTTDRRGYTVAPTTVRTLHAKLLANPKRREP
jgi:predicted phage-related endonuclease